MNWNTILRSSTIPTVLISLFLTGCLETEAQITQDLSPANQDAVEIQDPLSGIKVRPGNKMG